MDEVKLKLCPFCGHKRPQPFERSIDTPLAEHKWKIVYFVLCPVCNAEGPCCNSERDLTMEEALAAWNNRIADV